MTFVPLTLDWTLPRLISPRAGPSRFRGLRLRSVASASIGAEREVSEGGNKGPRRTFCEKKRGTKHHLATKPSGNFRAYRAGAHVEQQIPLPKQV